MANPLSLIRKAGEVASRSKPFYSAVDEALSSLPNKALGEQMVKELLKKGVKPQEIIDRNLDAILGAPIVQKTRTVKLKKPDAKGRTEIEEKYFEVTPSQKGEKAISRADVERAAAENPAPQVEERTLRNQFPFTETKFAKYSIPGGENYREVLIRLPDSKQLTYDQWAKNVESWGRVPNREEYDRLIAKKLLPDEKYTYQSGHWEQPNVLAHARVSDRTGPNGEKILHVEEIQSDWHQEGRKKGYKSEEIEKRLKESAEELSQIGLKIRQLNHQMARMTDGDMDEFNRLADQRNALHERQGFLIDEGNALLDKRAAGVPDAPFKSTWHELVMKRLLDDAARNGYDRVVITPGAEQAARYDLSKQVENIYHGSNPDGTYHTSVTSPDGDVIWEDFRASPEKIEQYLGKEIAQKITSGQGVEESGMLRLDPEDMKVGGEGMKGFYDQIIPSYLNKYGEKWGAKVQPYSYSMEGAQNPLHAFDITPQMREEIVGKGQPLYQVVPPAIGAGALMQEEEPGMKRGGAVNGDAMRMAVWNKQIQHKVNGKNIEHRQVGGAMRSIKAAANALKKIDVLPDAESKANLAKMLELSKTPMRLYHGTTATEGGKGQEAIKRFKPSKEGALGSGVYLTPNTAHASGYSGSPNDEAIAAMLGNKHYADTGLQFLRNQQTGNVLPGQEGGNMLPVYAQIKNPLILEGKGDPMIEALTKLGMDEDKATRMVERAYENKGYIGKEVETRARAVGYDGLMQYRDGNLSEVVVYNPNAIKSAIGNRGTYDLTDPDITKAKGGRIGNPDDKQFKAKQLRKKNA